MRLRGLGAVSGRGLHVNGRGGHVQSRARLQHIDHDEADDQRDRRHDLEVDERAQPDTADLTHGTHVRDADDNRREDDRRDHHADQLDESIAERPHRGAGFRPGDPDEHAERNARQHLDVEVSVHSRCSILVGLKQP